MVMDGARVDGLDGKREREQGNTNQTKPNNLSCVSLSRLVVAEVAEREGGWVVVMAWRMW